MATITESLRVSAEGDSLRWFAVCVSCGIMHIAEGEGEAGRTNAWKEIKNHTGKGFWTHDTKAVRTDMITGFSVQGFVEGYLG